MLIDESKIRTATYSPIIDSMARLVFVLAALLALPAAALLVRLAQLWHAPLDTPSLALLLLNYVVPGVVVVRYRQRGPGISSTLGVHSSRGRSFRATGPTAGRRCTQGDLAG